MAHVSDPIIADVPGSPAPVSVKAAAYDNFQHALLSGKLRCGQFVSQRDLMVLLDLSIGALRELLPRLEAESLLTVLPQRGIQITTIDLVAVRSAFQMRMALEREAVITAVRNATDINLDQQAGLHHEMLERLTRDMTAEFLGQCQKIDTEFHARLITGTGNELIMQAYNVVSVRIRLINRDRIILTPATLPDAFGDHLKIIDAIKARDVHAAIDAMDAHMMHARSRAMQL